MADHFIETKIPQQRNYNNINSSSPFPSVLSPNPATTATVSRLAEKVRTQKPFLDSLLLKAGSVLFTGFDDVKTAEDFSDVVEAFGYEELSYVGGAAPRTNIVGLVFTANESPPGQKIPFTMKWFRLFSSHRNYSSFVNGAEKWGRNSNCPKSHWLWENEK